MLPDAQLLTGPTTVATCNPDLSFTAKSLITSSFIFLQVSPDTKQEEPMSTPQPRPRSTANDDTELWFNLPSTRRRQEQQQHQSAYQATTTTRHRASRSFSEQQAAAVPLISTTTVALNKPLPPNPASPKKKHKPFLLDLIKRKPAGNLDPSHLQPGSHRRTSSNDRLSPEPYHSHYESRSMPSSPLRYSPPSDMLRARSAAAHYSDEPQYHQHQQYQPYSLRPDVSEQQRAVSMATYFEAGPPRPRRTFPDSNTHSSATAREALADAPRPHTWMSPTEPFGDASDFHLFVEATAGLPDGSDPLSSSDSPRLQGSLFARGSQNDRIPFLARNTSAQSEPVTTEVPQYDWASAQAPQDFSVSASALPRRDSYGMNAPSSPRVHLNAINLELERLGLAENEQRPPDDELPDYAQSQREMHALKRREAAARARELESRWKISRGWRSG